MKTTVALTRKTGKGRSRGKSHASRGTPLRRKRLVQVLPLHTPTNDGCSCRKSKMPERREAPSHQSGGSRDASADADLIRGWWGSMAGG